MRLYRHAALIAPLIVAPATAPAQERPAAATPSLAFTILNGHNIVISAGAATLNLQAGTVNTIAIAPNTTSGSFRLINIPRCS